MNRWANRPNRQHQLKILECRTSGEIGPEAVDIALVAAICSDLGIRAVDLIEVASAGPRDKFIVDVANQDLCLLRLRPFPGLLDG
jgi:hypothetical protein